MTPRAYRLCFVCTGNICRSPMAEIICRELLPGYGLGDGLVTVSSAGTDSWHEGEGADPRTVRELAAAGYPGGERHVARGFTAADLTAHDLVVALDRGHLAALRRLAPTPADAARIRLLCPDGTDVPDPYYGGPEGFTACRELIEAALPHLLTEVGTAIGTATGTDAATAHHGKQHLA
ncbi:low molecular weight protein-tyrosine-phosphatase [Streptomyces carpaticus]|uniref:low molecular weight protein-tyrosine-phosphatase n=1 Tax=Streptomyces carpaticus TaxID=285558 RepID=UPI0031F82911